MNTKAGPYRLATKCLFGSLEKRGYEYSKEKERNGSHTAWVINRESFGGFKCFVRIWEGTGRHGEDNQQDGLPGIGLSWGDGVLTYKGQDYPFTFQAKGLFRDVDGKITAAELSGQVFNLKRAALFNGTYHKVDAKSSDSGAGSRATMKNLNGVTVSLVSTIEGRKFVLGRDGITIKLNKAETLK